MTTLLPLPMLCWPVSEESIFSHYVYFLSCVYATSCCWLPSSDLLYSALFLCHFPCPGRGAAYRGSSLATRRPSSPIHPLLKHLPFLLSFRFHLVCISVSNVSSYFGELLCCPRCWRVQLSLVGIRSPDRPARSQSLYRLSYPVHYFAST
jgi:hypothetical protein